MQRKKWLLIAAATAILMCAASLCACENGDESHLHMSATLDGKSVNIMDIMGKTEQTEMKKKRL